MKKFTNITTMILSIVLMSSFSTSSEAEKKFYNAYISGIKSFWNDGIQQLNVTKKSSNEEVFRLILGQYGLLNSTMADQDEATFDKYYDSTVDKLKMLIKEEYKRAACKALLSSVYGFEMGYKSWKGIYLGPKSGKLIDEAMKEGKDSPIVWKMFGGSKLFTPKTWGGDPEKAVEAFEKSIALFEEQGETEGNWLYLDTHALLGIAYSKVDKKDQAKTIFQKALELEPDYGWVKYSLLPKLEK